MRKNQPGFRTILLIVLCWLAISHSLFAQLNNIAFFENNGLDSLYNKEFAIGLDHLNFLKNNEYFTKMTDGYTAFGFHLIPKAYFRAHPRFRLEGGAFIWKDYGQNGIHQVEPVFTARYTTGNHQILMGTLDGGLAHNMIEPLYDFENQLIRRLEYGFQWKHQTKKIGLDAWMDWRNMIYNFSTTQEQIVGGLNLQPVLFSTEKFQISVALQGNAYHKGGQIDTTRLPLTTWFNYASGLKIQKSRGNGNFLKSVDLEGYMVGFYDHSFVKQFPFSSSVSAYLNLCASTKWINLMVSYWNGDQFTTFQGGKLYRSVSTNIKENGRIEKNRELIIIRMMKDWEIAPNIFISARIEPYLDLKNDMWEFSHGLYFNYRGQLWRSKQVKL